MHMGSIKDPARTRILTGPDNLRKTFSHTDTPGRVKQKARDTETEERKEKQRRRLPPLKTRGDHDKKEPSILKKKKKRKNIKINILQNY